VALELFAAMLLPLPPLLLLELPKLLALLPSQVPRPEDPNEDPDDDRDGDELTQEK
jgi:hypothetical protein